jgi:hypothetical protein
MGKKKKNRKKKIGKKSSPYAARTETALSFLKQRQFQ